MKAILISFALISLDLFAQTEQDSLYYETEEIISNVLEEPGEEIDNSDLYNDIEEFISNPVDINEAGLSDLQSVPFIDYETASLIVDYRKKSGYFFSVNELYSINELSKEKIDKIKPFLTVSNNYSSRTVKSFSEKSTFHLRSRIQNDLKERKGFIDNKFAGSSYKVYNKFSADFKNYKFGFLTDKDPGENSIYDFTSFYFSANNLGPIDNIILGDYTVRFGQGLSLWSSYGFSKGADAVFPVKKKGSFIKKYTSSAETNFLRGAAVEKQINNFSIAAFYSKNKVDASIDSVSHLIISKPLDGLHRTATEMAKRKSAAEEVIGSVLSYHNKFLGAGILFYNSTLSNSFSPGSVYDFSGNRFNYTSIFYDFFWEKINLFGETVYDGSAVSTINGFQIPINKDFTFVCTIRIYPADFRSVHGFSFGENSGSRNEIGIYNGLKWNSPAGIINFYYDQFKFPYASYRIPVPSTGNEFLFDYKNKFEKNFDIRFRYKYQKKETAFDENNLTVPGNKIKKLSAAEINYRISRQIKLKGRFDYVFINMNSTSAEDGFLASQDIVFSVSSLFDLYSKIIFFKTDSFNSALYEYENDLPGILSSTALFGEGIRWYFLLRIKPVKIFTLSCKYSETYKPKERSIGSGLSEIDGNLDNRLSLQIDINY
jgi:hypothetical protein